jgi:clan AA aspartic protease
VEIAAVVDTGFTGMLALPRGIVAPLGLVPMLPMVAELADTSAVFLDVFEAVVIWQGFEVEVAILVTGDRPLLGTGLLAGWELRAQFIEGGQVTVAAIE